MSFYQKINAIIPQRKTQVFREGAQQTMYTPLSKPEPLPEPEPYIPTSEDKLIGRLGPTLYMDNQRIKQARRAKGIQTPRPEQFKDEIDRLINENKMSGKGWWNNIKKFLKKKSTNETVEEHKDEEEQEEEHKDEIEREITFSDVEEKLPNVLSDLVTQKIDDVKDIEEAVNAFRLIRRRLASDWRKRESFIWSNNLDPNLDEQRNKLKNSFNHFNNEIKRLERLKKWYTQFKSKPKSCSSKDK